mmetsp:Transcript_666/g.1637  ORF Transcript_666/g.1637 Transcript_666/m.1637 type:complete len:825 (-) Transcript_666:81-2555(-)
MTENDRISALAALRSGAPEDKQTPSLGKHHEGSFRVYMRHKRAKLGNQYAQLRDERVPQIFAGEVFWINGVTALEPCGKSQKDMRDTILRHGGLYVDVDTPDVTIVICRNLNHEKAHKEKTIKRVHRKRFLLPSWVTDCVNAGQKLPEHNYVIEELRPEGNHRMFARLGKLHSSSAVSVVVRARYCNILQLAADASNDEAVAIKGIVQWVGEKAPKPIYVGMPVFQASGWNCIVRHLDSSVLLRFADKWLTSLRAMAVRKQVRSLNLEEALCVVPTSLEMQALAAIIEQKLAPGSQVAVDCIEGTLPYGKHSSEQLQSMQKPYVLFSVPSSSFTIPQEGNGKSSSNEVQSISNQPSNMCVTRTFGCQFASAKDMVFAVESLLHKLAGDIQFVTLKDKFFSCTLWYRIPASGASSIRGDTFETNFERESIQIIANALVSGLPYASILSLTLKCSDVDRLAVPRNIPVNLTTLNQTIPIEIHDDESSLNSQKQTEFRVSSELNKRTAIGQIDPVILASLPMDLQNEVLQAPEGYMSPKTHSKQTEGSSSIVDLLTPEKRHGVSANRCASQQSSGGSQSIDMSVWNCLPADVQDDLRREANAHAVQSAFNTANRTQDAIRTKNGIKRERRHQKSMLDFAQVVSKKRRKDVHAKAVRHASRQFKASMRLFTDSTTDQDNKAKSQQPPALSPVSGRGDRNIVEGEDLYDGYLEKDSESVVGLYESWSDIRPVILDFVDNICSELIKYREEKEWPPYAQELLASASNSLSSYLCGLTKAEQLSKVQQVLRLVQFQLQKCFPKLLDSLWPSILENTQQACIVTYGTQMRLV